MVSENLNSCVNKVESPVAASNHSAIVFLLIILCKRKHAHFGMVNYAKENFYNEYLLLSTVNLNDIFCAFSDVDDF